MLENKTRKIGQIRLIGPKKLEVKDCESGFCIRLKSFRTNSKKELKTIKVKGVWKLRLLFACVENACRSQMAEGFARHFGDEEIQISSGGSKPGDKVNPKAVTAMKEKGMDISSHEPETIDPEDARKVDYVITPGCGSDACLPPVGGKTIEWDIENPSGKSIQKFREVRDKIEENVRELLGELDLE